MHLLIDIVAYLIAIPVSLALLVLALECFLALLPSRVLPQGQRKPCVVLIPAHDEEQGIEATLLNVKGSLIDQDRIVVVADNCTDATPDIARRHGAEVVVRNDSDNRGKGFALAAGVEHIQSTVSDSNRPPAVLVVLDADCQFADGALDRLVRIASDSKVPIQSLYLMHVSTGSSPAQNLSAFAFLTKNHIRPRGLARAGLPVSLTGSGMAFPWELVSEIQWGTAEIVEDLELGLQLVQAGKGALFCEDAQVDSRFPDSVEASKQQRARWELGYLAQMRKQLPALLRAGLARNWEALIAGLDLLVPPLSLLVLVAAVVGPLLTLWAILGESTVPLWIFIVSASAASLALFATWWRFGRHTISLYEFAGVPAYAGKKIAMYATAPFVARRTWKRTERS